MDDSKFDVMLDANDPNFVEQLRNALGLREGEVLRIVTPQFKRTDGLKIGYFPRTEREYDALRKFSGPDLKALGCQIWEKGPQGIHWLYPGEWYDFIPNGYPVTSITGWTEPFIKGETDNDIRFGALAYGFIQSTH